MLTRNTELNRVFDEAVIRNYLTEANKPKLEEISKKSERAGNDAISSVKSKVFPLIHDLRPSVVRAAVELGLMAGPK
jgi:hypothetical protein